MIESKLTIALALMLWAATTRSAEKLESLDEDFLAYLAEYEGDEDDWTIVEPVTTKGPAAKTAKPVKELPPENKPAIAEDGSKR